MKEFLSDRFSLDPTNWGTSISIYKATPGSINSITEKNFDVELAELIFNPQYPIEGDTISVSVKVKNLGLNDANFSLQLLEDTNLDSIPDILIEELQNLSLVSGDSSIFDFSFLIENLQSQRAFLANAVFISDEDTSNNKSYKSIEPGLPAQSIVINEIMYTPLGGEPEWIEIYNRTNLSINLNGWSITMTAMIDRLIQLELVKRKRDERDRRVVMVMLTPEGKKVIDTLMVIRKQEIEKLLQALTHEEVDLFLGSIGSVAQLLAKARINSEES